MTIEQLQEKFRSDESWNTLEANGSHRFDKEIEWIGNMLRQYAKDLGISEEEVVELAEKSRDYSWPNYYQEANFPGVNRMGLSESLRLVRSTVLTRISISRVISALIVVPLALMPRAALSAIGKLTDSLELISTP